MIKKSFLFVFLTLYTPWLACGSDLQTRQSNLYPYQSSVFLQDDFILGTATSGSIGAIGWSGGGTITVRPSETNRPGIIRASTGAVSGTVSFISFNSLAITPSLQHVINWGTRLNTIDANTTTRIGSGDPVSSNPPTDGIYFEKLDADTNWFCVTRAAGAQTRTDTGSAIAVAFDKLEYKRTTSNVEFMIDNALVCTHTTNIPTSPISALTQIINSAAAAKTIDIEYFQLVYTGIVRP